MRQSLKKRCISGAADGILLVLLAFFGLESPAFGQWITPSAPAIISFIGTLYAPGQVPREAKARYTLDLEIDGQKKWVFLVTNANNLSYAATMNQIFNDLIPPRLALTGDRKLVEKLSRSNGGEKPILIQGILYKEAHRLHVSKVEPPP